MKRKAFLVITLILTLTVISCTPLERQAYRVIVTSKDFLDSERAAHPECSDAAVGFTGTQSVKVCTALVRAVAAKDSLIDAVEVYCASPTFSSGSGICTPPHKGNGYQQAIDKLQAAILIYEQAETDLKGAIK